CSRARPSTTCSAPYMPVEERRCTMLPRGAPCSGSVIEECRGWFIACWWSGQAVRRTSGRWPGGRRQRAEGHSRRAQRLVELRDRPHHRLDREARLDRLPGRGAHLPRALGVREQLAHG